MLVAAIFLAWGMERCRRHLYARDSSFLEELALGSRQAAFSELD